MEIELLPRNLSVHALVVTLLSVMLAGAISSKGRHNDGSILAATLIKGG